MSTGFVYKWCDIAPIECTCLGTNCKNKGGR